jgi:hypothetical protein
MKKHYNAQKRKPGDPIQPMDFIQKEAVQSCFSCQPFRPIAPHRRVPPIATGEIEWRRYGLLSARLAAAREKKRFRLLTYAPTLD